MINTGFGAYFDFPRKFAALDFSLAILKSVCVFLSLRCVSDFEAGLMFFKLFFVSPLQENGPNYHSPSNSFRTGMM